MCPIDQRIQAFLDRYLQGSSDPVPRLPGNSLILDRYGLAEEEHAGGALAFARRSHAEEYGVDSSTRKDPSTFSPLVRQLGEYIDVQAEGYAIDRRYPDLIYVPRDIRMRVAGQRISWKKDGIPQEIRLQPGKVYMQPSGYKIEMEKHPDAPS